MSLFELIVFIINIVIGVRVAEYCHGIAGFWLSIPGFILGFATLPAIIMAWRKYADWAYPEGNDMPDCECGSRIFDFKKIDKDYRLVCRNCKRQYKRHKDKTFAYAGREQQLYRVLVKYKGWTKP